MGNQFVDLFSFSSIIGIIGTIVATIACPIIADRKNRSVGGWIFGGLLLGWLGLIIIVCLKDLTVHTYYTPSDHPFPQKTNFDCNPAVNSVIHRWRCSACGNMISNYPCGFCGYLEKTEDTSEKNSQS